MNVAGPSRLAQGGRVESTYEEDLLGLLNGLTLDEINEMQALYAHRARSGNQSSDHDVAMNDLLQQAHALAVLNQDRALAQRIADGEVPRQAVVPRPNGTGTPAQRNGIGNPQRALPPVPRNTALPFQTWRQWFSSVVDWVIGAKPASETCKISISKTTVPKAPVSNRPTGHDCVICQDPIYGAEIRTPCGHYYGIDCITDLFQSATRDESLFPPRCCRRNIPFIQVRPHLSQALVTTFQEKQTEFGTLKRVYCSSPTCSRFLGPLSEGVFTSKVYTCPAPGCGRRTCGKCREQYNDWTHTCRPDADATQVLELGRNSGWSRCPGCSQMIELHIGCFHMTCRCRTEFCYLCRARWKTCQCPQWDERRLMVAAEERVNAQVGVGRERGLRRDVPGQRAAPVPAPILVNRGARPATVPALPIPAPRPAGTAPTPTQFAAPARASVVEIRHPLPIPTHTTTASSSATRPISTASTLSRDGLNWNSAAATSRTPAFAPTSASTSASTSRSTPTSAVPSAARPKHMLNADQMHQRLVREMMERLREDHECDHGRWRYRKGGGICQSCGDHLPLYLFLCRGCGMLACNRCRRNRL